MDQKEILRRVDHTVLTPTATWEQVKAVCDEGKQFCVASVCVPPRYVKRANDYVGSSLKICTVVGFPNGYSTPEVKVFETEDAIRDGADEIDMVINIGKMLHGDEAYVQEEIRQIAEEAHRRGAILKVILETCYLNDEQIERACRLSVEAHATFVKTSTGFGTGGATVHDVALMTKAVNGAAKVKASGGIHTAEEAAAMVEAGADRIGTSSGIAIVAE